MSGRGARGGQTAGEGGGRCGIGAGGGRGHGARAGGGEGRGGAPSGLGRGLLDPSRTVMRKVPLRHEVRAQASACTRPLCGAEHEAGGEQAPAPLQVPGAREKGSRGPARDRHQRAPRRGAQDDFSTLRARAGPGPFGPSRPSSMRRQNAAGPARLLQRALEGCLGYGKEAPSLPTAGPLGGLLARDLTANST